MTKIITKSTTAKQRPVSKKKRQELTIGTGLGNEPLFRPRRGLRVVLERRIATTKKD